MPATLFIDDISELPKVFASIEEDFELIDFAPVMEGELDRLADLHRGYFDNQKTPDGASWAPNAHRTIAQKGHSQILRGIRQEPARKRQGVKQAARFSRFRLSRSLTLKARQSVDDAIREVVSDSKGAALSFGTDVEYSGYNDRPNPRNGAPARPHVGVDMAYLDGLCERVADFAIKELARG